MSSLASDPILDPLLSCSPEISWRLDLDIATYRTKEFGLKVSQVVVSLSNKPSLFTYHCMVYRKGTPAYTSGGEIINRPVVAQFNSVTELSLVQGES